MGYTESETVEKPIIEFLMELGWEYFEPDSIDRDYDEAFDKPRLREALQTFNQGVLRSEADVDKVVDRLLYLIPNDIRGNKEFFDWLKNEGSISLRPGEQNKTIKLIDYERPENNSFTVTNQYKFHGYENIKPDIILFINGIPLILIECKTQSQETIDYTNAITQIIRYNREAPQLFKHLAFCCATDGVNFRYGWTSPGRYFRWRNGHEDPLRASVMSILQKDRVLDFIQNFIVFETSHEEITKKIAMQQQYEATNKIINRVLNDEDNRGLVWHTQGSGKTLTMLYTAWKLKRQPELENPTILVVIDRIQLEKQFRETFVNVGLPYVTYAESIRDLLSKIRMESREVIITTIQKFENPRYTDTRENIIILIDEAHRSQYGQLAIRMRTTFPNARIFGFTGTPIDKGAMGRSTFTTFCLPEEKYLHKYSIKQSIEDGSTVPIVYEPRLTHEHIPKEILDREFLNIAGDLTEEEQEEVLRKSAKLRTILKAGHRIERIAKDIAEHYVSHVEPNGFKAQLVAVDREACALYKEELDRHLPPEYSMVIYSAGQNDKELLRKYHLPRTEQLKISRQEFQKQDTLPNILIVTDMLLTGFDAPIERVMYLDKPLRDHKLLQAIARTNRPYPNKDSALIVDYVGIFYRLQEALNFEIEDIEGVAELLDVLKLEFKETIQILRELCKDVPKENTRVSIIAAIKLLTDDEIREKFKTNLARAKALFETIAPDPDLEPYLNDYAWFNKINDVYNKHIRADKDSLKPYQAKTEQLIKDTLILEDIDKTLPSFKIGPNYLEQIEEAAYDPEYEVAELRQAIRHYIRINIELNPVLETLGERLERLVKRKDPEQMKVDLKAIIEEINRLEAELEEKGLSPEEHALLIVTSKHLEGQAEEGLIEFVKGLEKSLEDPSFIFPGWHTKAETRKNVKKHIFDACFNRFKDIFPVGKIFDLAEDLMEYITRFRS